MTVRETKTPRDPNTHGLADTDSPTDGSQNFRPRSSEVDTLDIPASDAPNTGSDELDRMTQQAGTTVCFWCDNRKPVAEIEECERKAPGRNCPKNADTDTDDR